MSHGYREEALQSRGRWFRIEALPPEARQRLREVCNQDGDAVLIRDIPWWARSPLGWCAGGGLVLGVFFAGLSFYAGLSPRLGEISLAERLLGALVFVPALFCILVGLRSWWHRQRLGFAPGIYLLHRDLLDARDPWIHLLPCEELEAIREFDDHLELHFQGGAHISLRDSVGLVVGLLAVIHERMQRAEAWAHTDAAAIYDPFINERPRWDSVSLRPPSRSAPLLWAPLLAALVLGGLGQWGFWRSYTDFSDHLLVSTLLRENREEELKQLLFLAQRKGQAGVRREIDLAWFTSLKRSSKGSQESARVWLDYLKSGGAQSEAEDLLLVSLSGCPQLACQEALDFWGTHREDLVERLLAEDSESFWLGYHGQQCTKHHRIFLGRELERARESARNGDVSGLFRIAASRLPLRDDPYHPPLPDVTAQANLALDQVYAQASDTLRAEHLSEGLERALLRTLTLARGGQFLSLQVRLSADLPPPERASLEADLCNHIHLEMKHFLPQQVLQALIPEVPYPSVQRICVEREAVLTIRCTTRIEPSWLYPEQCTMEFAAQGTKPAARFQTHLKQAPRIPRQIRRQLSDFWVEPWWTNSFWQQMRQARELTP